MEDFGPPVTVTASPAEFFQTSFHLLLIHLKLNKEILRMLFLKLFYICLLPQEHVDKQLSECLL